jgi:hypothetical protein
VVVEFIYWPEKFDGVIVEESTSPVKGGLITPTTDVFVDPKPFPMRLLPIKPLPLPADDKKLVLLVGKLEVVTTVVFCVVVVVLIIEPLLAPIPLPDVDKVSADARLHRPFEYSW